MKKTIKIFTLLFCIALAVTATVWQALFLTWLKAILPLLFLLLFFAVIFFLTAKTKKKTKDHSNENKKETTSLEDVFRKEMDEWRSHSGNKVGSKLIRSEAGEEALITVTLLKNAIR
ncbi:hypothetical protein V6R21_14355 [Limibacter armeniacum]|uniref:hypothetical protein n=1 Tax=Limibacter armeniacum TaxID=466084 RepID=UPI002FE54A53